MTVLQQFLNDIAYVLRCTCANINGDGTDTRVEIGSYPTSGSDHEYTACCAVQDPLDDKKYHTDDMITCIAHLRNTQNQKICPVCNDITEPSTPSTDPGYTTDYDNAYLTGVHPDLCVYTPSGKYAEGTMYHMPGTGNMAIIAAMSENQPYTLCAGTDGCVVWCCSGTTGTACHLYGPASLCFNCGGYVSAGTEWSFGGANNYTPGTTYICNFNSSNNKLQTCVKCSGYYAAGSFAQTLPHGNVTASSMLSGYCAYNSAGTLVTGTIKYSNLYQMPRLAGSGSAVTWDFTCTYWDVKDSLNPSQACARCCMNFNRHFYASSLMPITVCLCTCVAFRPSYGEITVCCIDRSITCKEPFGIQSVCTSYACTGSVTTLQIYLYGFHIEQINTGNTTGGTPVASRLYFRISSQWPGSSVSSNQCKPIIWSCYGIPESP